VDAKRARRIVLYESAVHDAEFRARQVLTEVFLKKEPDRDAVMGDMIRRALADQSGAKSADACLDADIIAAWADNTLTPRERVAAEEHAAGCPRCQALLASMVRTAPELRHVTGWWRTRMVRWLVPASGVAAALAIWLAIDMQQRAPERQDVTAVRTPSVPPAVVSEPKPENQPTREAARAQEERTGRSVQDRRTKPESGRRQREQKVDAAPPQTLAEKVVPSEPVPAPAAAAPPPAAARVEGMARQMAAIRSAPVDVVSPDPSSRWRLSSGVVFHSADGGLTWERQDTGTSNVTAGSAPAASICWLVGRAGTVLLTIDGKTWQRLTSPDAVDLVAVQATSADAATVTSVDGRTFSTSDRGRTWSRELRSFL
jgi:hypothetical protein